MSDAAHAESLHSASPVPRVLVTAGPTQEPIDAVRYIGNRSSGRMGIALALAAGQRGWPTTLLLGPAALVPPDHSRITTLRFRTTSDLAGLLDQHWPSHDVLIMAAAVADFRPIHDPGEVKLKRTNGPITLTLEPTPDLLASLSAATRADQIRIGFALESPKHLDASARSKLKAKQLDAIVANPLKTMDAPTVTATVLFADGQHLQAPSNMTKADFAAWLLDTLTPLVDRRMPNRTANNQ